MKCAGNCIKDNAICPFLATLLADFGYEHHCTRYDDFLKNVRHCVLAGSYARQHKEFETTTYKLYVPQLRKT